MNGAAHASTTNRKLRRRRCTQASAPSQPRTPRAGGRTGAGPGRNRRGAARNHGGRAHRGRGRPQVRRRTMKRRLKRHRGSRYRRARRQERAAGERVETPRSRPALTAMLLAAAATTRVAWPKNEGVQEGPAEGLEPGDAKAGAHGEPPRGLHNPRKHTHTRISEGPENTHTHEFQRHTDHTNHRAAAIAVVGPVGMLMALLFAVGVYVYAYRCLAEDGNRSPGEGRTGAERGRDDAPTDGESVKRGIGLLLRHARRAARNAVI